VRCLICESHGKRTISRRGSDRSDGDTDARSPDANVPRDWRRRWPGPLAVLIVASGIAGFGHPSGPGLQGRPDRAKQILERVGLLKEADQVPVGELLVASSLGVAAGQDDSDVCRIWRRPRARSPRRPYGASSDRG